MMPSFSTHLRIAKDVCVSVREKEREREMVGVSGSFGLGSLLIYRAEIGEKKHEKE